MADLKLKLIALVTLSFMSMSACGTHQNKAEYISENTNYYDEHIVESNAISSGDKAVNSALSDFSDIQEFFSKNFQSNSSGISYAYHNYTTGESFTKNSGRMKSASIIKLFIMEYAYDMMANGEISSDGTISKTKLSALIESMITISDNNATNTLIDYFTIDKLNAYFAQKGYTDTILGRKMLDYEAQKNGKDNLTSVNDVMKFLDNLYHNKENEYAAKMLDILSRQKVNTKIRRDMPSDVKICNKTGELSDVENDAGIVFTPNVDFAVVFMTNSSDTYTMKNAIAKTTRQIYDNVVA